MRKVARQTGLSGTDNPTSPTDIPTGTLALTTTNGSGTNPIPLTADTPTSAGTSTPTDGSQTTPTPTTIVTTPTTTDKPTTTTGTTGKTGTTDTTTTPTSTPTSTTTSKSDSTSTTSSITSDPTTTSTTSPTPSTTSSSPSSSSTNSTPTSSSASSQSSSSTPPLTTSFTIITTAVNGELTTLTSPLPTSLSTSLPSNATNRTAVIAGGTAAAVVVILLILGGVFLHHRHKLRQRQAISSIHSRSREGPREGRGLLAGEDFDFDDGHPVHMRSYRDSELSATTRSAGTLSPQSLSPSLHRHRASDTGSIFREEEVWPPPGEFEDPFLRSVRRNQEVDLGKIVDDIMGRPEEYRSGHTPTPSSSSGNDADRSTSPSARRTHRASDSDTSYTGLMDGFRDRQQSPASSSSLYKDPYSPFRDSLGGKGKGDSTTVYTPLPPGAAVPLQDSGHDPMVIAPGAYSLKPPLMVQKAAAGASPTIGGIPASKPKKPSPLARAMSNASIKMGGLWLNRKVNQHRADHGDADVDGGAIGMAL